VPGYSYACVQPLSARSTPSVQGTLRQQTSWSADRESAENKNRPDIFLNNPQITRVCTLVHNVAGVVATRVQPSHTRGPNQNVYLEENHHERSNLNHRWSSADKGRQRYKPSLNNAKKHTHIPKATARVTDGRGARRARIGCCTPPASLLETRRLWFILKGEEREKRWEKEGSARAKQKRNVRSPKISSFFGIQPKHMDNGSCYSRTISRWVPAFLEYEIRKIRQEFLEKKTRLWV